MSWNVVVPESELLSARDDAMALMVDVGKALHPTGVTAYDPAAKAEVDTYSDVFGPVQCKIKPPRTVTRDVEVGGRTSVVIPGELHLPADPDHPEYAELTPGDVWEMVELSPQSLSRVGRRYRITGEADGTMLTACRYAIERVVS